MLNKNIKKIGPPGFSAVEILIVLAMVGILSAFAIPSLSSAMRDMQFISDARNVSSALGYARLKAKSMMNPYRIEFDLDDNQWSVKRYDSGSDSWVLEQAVNELSSGVSNSGISLKGSAGSAPTGFPDTSSATITFNSRGIPVSGTTPTPNNIIYISRSDTDYYAITVTLTGKVQVWKKSDDGWCDL
ncbi:MAG: GspH/FimT family pseudopilin [Acidobacteriota bacterium]